MTSAEENPGSSMLMETDPLLQSREVMPEGLMREKRCFPS